MDTRVISKSPLELCVCVYIYIYIYIYIYAVKLLLLCPTLCSPTDCSLTGSSVHGLFQARVLEWGAQFLGVKNVTLGRGSIAIWKRRGKRNQMKPFADHRR